MKFRASISSYILLGIVFMIVVGLPAAIIVMLITTPVMVLGALAGNLVVVIISTFVMFLIGAAVMGWLVFRFVRKNRFG